MNWQKRSETIIPEEGDIKAEYLFQRVILDKDMVQGCLEEIAGIFNKRQPLLDMKGIPLESFVKECRESGSCEVIMAHKDCLAVRFDSFTIQYEPMKRCLMVIPDSDLTRQMMDCSGFMKIRLISQRYWVTASMFPPLSVFLGMDRICEEMILRYEFLEQWSMSGECRAAESALRELLRDYMRATRYWPEEAGHYLVFGIPSEGGLRISLCATPGLYRIEGSRIFSIEGCTEDLHNMLLQYLEHEAAKIQAVIEKEQSLRKHLERRFTHELTDTEIDSLVIKDEGWGNREDLYLAMGIHWVREHDIWDFRNSLHFFVRVMIAKVVHGEDFLPDLREYIHSFGLFGCGWTSDSRLIESAGKTPGADTEVIRDEEGNAISVHFHFEVFDADYDLCSGRLGIILKTDLIPGTLQEKVRLEFSRTDPNTSLRILNLCTCHDCIRNGFLFMDSQKVLIEKDMMDYEKREEGVMPLIRRAGCLLVPFEHDDSLFRLELHTLAGKGLGFSLNPCWDPFEKISAEILFDGFVPSLSMWWIQLKMSLFKASKFRELEQRSKLAVFERTISGMNP